MREFSFTFMSAFYMGILRMMASRQICVTKRNGYEDFADK